MKILKGYVQGRWRTALLFLAFAGVMGMVFALYELPLEAVGYGAGLCLFLGAVVTGIDLAHYRRRHQALLAQTQAALYFQETLPSPRDGLEADYQALVAQLQQERKSLQLEGDRRYGDMMEYYTLWAHQIKTPIAAMELMLQREEAPDRAELRGQLFRIEQYVDMVLGYLRLDSDSTDHVLQVEDLDAILRRAIRKYASQFIRRRITLVYDGVDKGVLTDGKWLGFVVEQLLSNALKYTPAGSVSIYLEEPATLVIADTGIGIASEDLPRIFEKGYTGFTGRTDQASTGIGLYLCKRVCDDLGHSLTITSRPGAGTTVRLGLESVKLSVE
jgi:hypothetical protein